MAFDNPDSKETSEGRKPKVVFIPTIEFFRKRYAAGTGDTDQRDLGVFKSYETKERFRQLQSELQWVKEDLVDSAVCDKVIGKTRRSRYQSYQNWGRLMLLWAISARS